MTNKKVAELDAEFIEYKAKVKASMDALEKKIEDGVKMLDASIKAMKEESDAKFEELKQLVLGTSTHVDHVPQTTKVAAKTVPYVPPIRQGSNKLNPRITNDMIGERFKTNTDSVAVFVEGMQPTGFKGFRREFKVDLCRCLKVKMHMDGYLELKGILKFKDFCNMNNYEEQLYVWEARLYLGIDGVRDELHSIRGMVVGIE
nr:hypothetical protein [Tanacetum cinerariifolium]